MANIYSTGHRLLPVTAKVVVLVLDSLVEATSPGIILNPNCCCITQGNKESINTVVVTGNTVANFANVNNT